MYKTFLERGCYYTSKEFSDFSKGYKSTLDYYPRSKGIYVSPKAIFVVYISKPGKNKNMVVYDKIETRYLELIERVFKPITSVFEQVPELQYKTDFIGRIEFENYYGKPRAIIFSDEDALASKMMDETVSGHFLGRSPQEVKEEMKKKKKKKQDAVKGEKFILSPNTNLYDFMYLVPYNSYGLEQLKYITSYSLEELVDDSKNLLLSFNNTQYVEIYDRPFPMALVTFTGRDQKQPYIFYLPYYDLCLMKRIGELDEDKNVIIFTKENMTNTISRCIRREAYYYVSKDGKWFLPEKAVTVYEKNGYSLGQNKLREYINEKGLYCAETEYLRLPTKFNMDASSFWNAIEANKISLDEAASKLTFSEKKKVKYNTKSVNNKILVILDSESDKRKLKKLAKLQNKSVSKYVQNIINIELQKYNLQIKEDDNDEETNN